MRIRVDRFCSLATARDWQTWLYKYNQDIYREFITRLRLTRGCDDNRILMEEFLTKIGQAGGTAELVDFLRSNHPHSIVESKPLSVVESTEWDRLFSGGILTYPKRKILFGLPEKLSEIVANFVSDKITYESLIINDRAYVEYLDKGDEHLFDQIPAQKWLIKGKKHG